MRPQTEYHRSVWTTNALHPCPNAWTNSDLCDSYLLQDVFMTLTFTQSASGIPPIEDQKAGGVLTKLANMAVSVGVLGSIFTAG